MTNARMTPPAAAPTAMNSALPDDGAGAGERVVRVPGEDDGGCCALDGIVAYSTLAPVVADVVSEGTSDKVETIDGVCAGDVVEISAEVSAVCAEEGVTDIELALLLIDMLGV